MFANLVQLITGRTTAGAETQAFFEEVRVQHREPRRPRVERLILVCWGLIAVKHGAIIWAVHHYALPIHPWWVNVPTWLLALLATGLFYGRTRRA